MLMKRAQINQAFIYIMILLIIGLLAVVGYKSITKLMKTGCDQQKISFENELLKYIDDYSERGSVHEESIPAPCGAIKVCFGDSSQYPGTAQITRVDASEADAVIKSHFGEGDNIFVKSEFTEAIGFSDKIALANGEFQCFNVINGNLRLIFKGQGRKTLIE